MDQLAVERSVEIICNKGCQQVISDIRVLERGDKPSGVEHLSRYERLQVLQELKSIMKVYGDSCSIKTDAS